MATPTMTPLPPAPSRSDDSVTFTNKADALLGSLQQFVTEANILIAGADLDALTASAAAVSAAGSASTATAAANTALLNTNIPRWVSGTTYADDATVISPLNSQAYRRRAAGAGTTDPSLDSTNWAPLASVVYAATTRTANYTVTLADRQSIQRSAATSAITFTFPAAASVGNGWFVHVLNEGTRNLTIKPNGSETVNGLASIALEVGACGLVVSDGTNLIFFRYVNEYTNAFANLTVSGSMDVRHIAAENINVTATGTISSFPLYPGQRKTLVFKTTAVISFSEIVNQPFGSDLYISPGTALTFIGDSTNRAVLTGSSSLQRPTLYVRDEKASGTAGGASVAGVNTRALGTVVTNEIFGASVASNVITLPAGKYSFKATAPCVAGGANRLSLYNTADSVYAVTGLSMAAVTAGNTVIASVEGTFTLSAMKTFTLRHQIATAVATNGLGVAVNDGQVEIYGSIQFWKEAGI